MFAEVIVPLPLNAVFTYSVPDELRAKIRVGARVIVPFGRRKFYTGIVESLTPIAPEGYEVKPIIRLLDPTEKPTVVNPQLKFWRWMAGYYMCSIGEVMKAALPSALKLESETFVELHPHSDTLDREELVHDEAMVIGLLEHFGRLTLGDLAQKLGRTTPPDREVASLLAKGLIMVSEKIQERYHSLRQTFVTLPQEAFLDPAEWRAKAFASIGRSPKQERVLLTLLSLLSGSKREVARAVLIEKSGCSAAIVKALAVKGLLVMSTRVVNRFAAVEGAPIASLPELSTAQTAARNSILDLWDAEGKNVVLLRGVTSSGKTEVYIHLIDRALRTGLQCLMLVPEIALTTQLTSRLQRVFGARVLVYHSKFSDSERVDIWRRLQGSREPLVVLGARSSVFLPFGRLGLVVVDEEHEPSYKQFDPAPRYNARDAAIFLASLHGAKVLLGSASPSIETYFKATSGRFGLVELTERFGGVQLPEIKLIDMHKEWQKTRSHAPIARELRQMVLDDLSRHSQSIIFLNRRGYSPFARCSACAFTPKCEHCDVSLTYHQRDRQLVCHYCGKQYPMPVLCPVCREPAVEVVGYGTERIEEEVEQQFPEAKILRMDLDTTRNKDGYQEIINAFSQRKADVLVGTQMVTKGLDFDGVSTVGVLNADLLINMPDFRASERAFNMLLQVAGRAGRREQTGRVAVQTSQPEHPVITHLLQHDYLGFYAHELADRRAHHYPPFSRMIFIYLRHREEENVVQMAEHYGRELTALLGTRVFGPDKPPVARVQNLFIRRFMLKIEPEASLDKVKALLHTTFANLLTRYPHLRTVAIHYDVDPA